MNKRKKPAKKPAAKKKPKKAETLYLWARAVSVGGKTTEWKCMGKTSRAEIEAIAGTLSR
jgi:hypothetical protein